MTEGLSDATTWQRERDDVLARLVRHGGEAVAFQALQPGFAFWREADAGVGYVDTGVAWVAAGAPIAAEGREREAAERFVASARAAGRRACFFAVSDAFVSASGLAATRIGEQPTWDPRRWPSVVDGARSLREQLRRARAKGVAVHEVAPSELAALDGPLRAAVDALLLRWLASRAMPPMGFVVAVAPFELAERRLYFLATRADKLVAFLTCVPVHGRSGWLLEVLARDPAAPNGTVELVIDSAMRAMAAMGAQYATLGLAPLSGEVATPLVIARRLGRTLFDFDGLRAFKAKLRPERWEPIYLARPTDASAPVAVWDVLAAFARGHMIGFGLHALARVPRVVPRAIALGLLPWTALLALAAPAHWFPSDAVRFAWTLADLALAAALWSLGNRWRSAVSAAVTAALTLDSALSVVQIALFDWSRAGSTAERVLFATSAALPAMVAVLFAVGTVQRSRWRRLPEGLIIDQGALPARTGDAVRGPTRRAPPPGARPA